MSFTYFILSALSVFALLGSVLILLYLVRTEWGAPKFARSIENLPNNPISDILVSIVVPARNEGDTICRCIESLTSQTYRNLEVIVVDDSSSDHTSEVVSSLVSRDGRVKLIFAGAKPEGWVGKSWPCWRGFESSRGAYLLFVDADSTIEPSTIDYSLRYVIENKIEMFSLSPRAEMSGLVARAVLPMISGAINLLYPMQKVNDKSSERAYVFGTFVLVRRSVYEETGGHQRVRGELVEDAAIARETKAAGYALRIERGSEFVSTEWESDARNVYQGLERITSNSIKSHGLLSILNVVPLFFITIYPIACLVFFVILHPAGYGAMTGLIANALNIATFVALAEFETNTIRGSMGISALLYPVGSIFLMSAIVSTSVKV